jgi:hypothetical protein
VGDSPNVISIYSISIYLLRIAFNAIVLSALNSTFCPPLFLKNRALMLPFKVAGFPEAGSEPVICSHISKKGNLKKQKNKNRSKMIPDKD